MGEADMVSNGDIQGDIPGDSLAHIVIGNGQGNGQWCWQPHEFDCPAIGSVPDQSNLYEFQGNSTLHIRVFEQ